MGRVWLDFKKNNGQWLKPDQFKGSRCLPNNVTPMYHSSAYYVNAERTMMSFDLLNSS